MEPVTHLLTGACLARTGFHRRIAYATATMAVAAEFPDIDTLWSLRGPIAGFEHHRGITHTFLGIPFEAGFLLLLAFAWHGFRTRRARNGQNAAQAAAVLPPVRWAALYGALLLALLSHLLLDYTNNYGLRPFFPFNDRWYAGSLVFIFDPAIFCLLLAGLALPWLFGLVNLEVGFKAGHKASPVWALTALLGVLGLWAVRSYEHGRAIALSQATTLRQPAAGVDGSPLTGPEADLAPETASSRPLLQAAGSLASPDPLSIFRWYTVTDYGPAYRLGTADTRLQTWDAGRILVKPADGAVLEAAKRSRLGRVYLDWSPMPSVTVRDGRGADAELPGESFTHAIHFEDPRFMGDTPLLHRGARPPLSGDVFLGQGNAVLAEGIDGRLQR